MEKQQPCYFCITMSLLLTVGMLFLTLRMGQRAVRLGRKAVSRR